MTTPQIADRIALLVALHQDHVTEMERLLKAAEDRKKMIDSIAREDLPELLREAEINELTLTDGTKVKCTEKVQAGITEANREEAHQWLIDHNFGGLIKTAVSVQFAAEEHDKAQALAVELKEKFGTAVEVNSGVHAATLKAFVAERLEAANEQPENVPPEKLFGVFTFTEAKITKPRKR